MDNPTADPAQLLECVRLIDQPHPVRLELDASGRVVRIQPAPADSPVRAVLMPPLADVHVHLDLAFSVDVVPPNRSGTLLEAIALWSEAKRTITEQQTTERAIRAIDEELSWGTTLLRSHVDVAATAGLRLARGVMAAREARRARARVQLVAFPQDGLIRDPEALANMRTALEEGVELVGGIPHVERTVDESREHIRLLFELARTYDRDIDVHIDETDAPGSRCVEVLASQTIRAGWQGRVTASHVCALASYDDPHAGKVIGLLAEAGISVVTNPQVNLHLQGRFDRYPKRRGLTRVRELLERGVPVAAGQDCICDPFYPLGSGNMIDVAHTLVHADHLSTPEQMLHALKAVSLTPAAIMCRPPWSIQPGLPLTGVLYDVPGWADLLRLRPRPRFVFGGPPA